MKRKEIGEKGVNTHSSSIKGGLHPAPLHPRQFVIGVDPGNSGAIVVTNGVDEIEVFQMPLDPEKQTDFRKVSTFFAGRKTCLVFLERAVSFGMGTKGAFNYGRGFAAIEIAVTIHGYSVIYVEPGRWTKVMHEGIARDLKPKAKSLIAVKRLFPQFVPKLPTNKKGVILDGPIDALLIAGYGLRNLNLIPAIPVTAGDSSSCDDTDDFF